MNAKRVIAIIDDDLPSVELLMTFLRKAGHDVHFFYDGLSGIRFVEKHIPDLVICDMLLPKLHGLDLCRKVKGNPGLRGIKVLLMTAVYRDARYRQEIKGSGADGFFTKPFDLDRILARIGKMFDTSSPKVEPAEMHDAIAAVGRDYAKGLPALIEQLESEWKSVSAATESSEVANFHLRVHALAGSSATFGFNQLSKWCAALSAYLQNLLDHDLELCDDERDKIKTYLVEIRGATPGCEPKTATSNLNAPDLLLNRSGAKKRMVFLVESNLALANELTLQMELFGFEVRHFVEIRELHNIKDKQPDAVVLEFELPEGQLIDLRERPLYHQVPMICISSETSSRARLTAIRIGADAFFSKPLDTSALVNNIDQLTHKIEPAPYRVLIVENDLDVAKAISKPLQLADMLTKVVDDPFEIMPPLLAFNPDLIVIDAHMTGCGGLELVRLIRQHQSLVGVAILLLTSEENPIKQQEALLQGVDDFITKPLKPGPLVSTITHRARRFREIRSFMVRDSLTGLLNTSSLDTSMTVELERARRQKSELVLALIDVDQLTRLNKMFQHVAGDQALRSLSRMLIQRLRKSDIVGRFEGPLLLTLLPETSMDMALKIFREIAADYARYRLHTGKDEYYATFSCGLAIYPRFKDKHALIDGARTALRKAKQLGGNRVLSALHTSR